MLEVYVSSCRNACTKGGGVALTLCWVLERWVQVVDNLREEVGLHIFSLLVQENDLNTPKLHWVSLNLWHAVSV